MEAAEGGQTFLLGVEPGQGAVHPIGRGKRSAVHHGPQLGQLHPLGGGGGEKMNVAGPGEFMVRGDLGIGVVVAGGKKHLGFQLLQHLVKGLDGLRPDPLAVEEVPGQEDQVGLALPGGVGQAGEELALLLPALCRLVGGQGVEGGV